MARQTILQIRTAPRGMTNISAQVAKAVAESAVATGSESKLTYTALPPS